MISQEEMNERLKYRTDLSEAELHNLWMALKKMHPQEYDNYINISNITDEDEVDQWILGLNLFLQIYFHENRKYYNIRNEVVGDMMSFSYKYLRSQATGDKFNG